MQNKIAVILLVLSMVAAVCLDYNKMQLSYERHILETECVEKLLKVNVSRKNIYVDKGTCYILHN
jgi:hypothetical protein